MTIQQRHFAFGLFLFALFFFPSRVIADSKLAVHFLKVGNSDATLILSSSGKKILLVGSLSSNSTSVLRYLRRLRIKKLNLLILTQTQSVQHRAFLRFVKSLKIRRVIGPAALFRDPAFRKFQRYLRRRSVFTHEALSGQILKLGDDEQIRVLSPLAKTQDSATQKQQLVLRLEYDRFKLLLSGSANQKTLRAIRDSDWLSAAVLKLPNVKTTIVSSEFLTKVKPNFAIFSCSRKLLRKRTHLLLQKTLSRKRIQFFSTGNDGHLILQTNGRRIWLSAHNKRKPQKKIDFKIPYAYTKSDPLPKQGGDSESKDRSRQMYTGQRESSGWLSGRPLGTVRVIRSKSNTPSAKSYVAARKSHYFHRENCHFVRLISRKQRVSFRSRKLALRSRRVPASDCVP